MVRIFISYARRDHLLVRKLATNLQAPGIDNWLDVQGIEPGMTWHSTIQGGLEGSETMLIERAQKHVPSRPSQKLPPGTPARIDPQGSPGRRSRRGLFSVARLLAVLIVAGIIVIPSVTSRVMAQQTHVPVPSRISVTAVPTATPIGTFSAPAAATDLPPGTTRTDPKGIIQVRVPAGCFTMGTDPHADNLGDLDEAPAHTVCLTDAFWMDRSEVTNADFQKFVADGGFSKEQYWDPAGWEYLQANHIKGPSAYPGFDGPEQPEVGVTFYSAQAYARWRGGRLPTEAEWEYAARGPKSLVYPWENTFNADFANVEGILGHTAPVGSYPKGDSWVGAHDMAGNAAEWTGDYYDRNYYSLLVTEDPPGAPRGDTRVIKGGSWASTKKQTRAAFRDSFTPDYRDNRLGFRVVTPES